MTAFNIINVPIESLVDRYSADWNLNFPTALLQLGSVHTVYPNVRDMSRTVVDGEFLNAVETNLFKATQLQEICQLIREGKVDSKTVIFFHDLWFPGLEALFYIRDAIGIPFKIAGMFHAGTWDRHDFLTHKGMSRWARGIEDAWLQEIDLPMVSTKFHADLIGEAFGDSKVMVVPFPLWHLPEELDLKHKEKIVVFPHRLADEKNPNAFTELGYQLSSHFPKWKFVRSKDVCSFKHEYFALLRKSLIAVSCAQQETWGIAQLEATAYGCLPLVPDALSYKEIYPSRYRYSVDLDRPGVPTSVSWRELQRPLSELIQRIESDGVWYTGEAARLHAMVHDRVNPSQLINALYTLL